MIIQAVLSNPSHPEYGVAIYFLFPLCSKHGYPSFATFLVFHGHSPWLPVFNKPKRVSRIFLYGSRAFHVNFKEGNTD